MNIDNFFSTDKIDKERSKELLLKVWNDICNRWDDHPSYQGQPFLHIVAVHQSLKNLKLIEEDVIDTAEAYDTIVVDVTLAKDFIRHWESNGWIKSLDKDLGDYIIDKDSLN